MHLVGFIIRIYFDKQEKFCGPTHVDSAGSLNVQKGGA